MRSPRAQLARTLAGLPFLLSMFSSCGPPDRPGEPPHHLLLVTVAGLRADHTSAYLYPRATSAGGIVEGESEGAAGFHLDLLAQEGLLFAQAFAPSTAVQPALAAVHTGRSPLDTGVLTEDGVLSDQELTLAEALQAAGFETVAFVSSAQGKPAPGLRQGFGHFSHARDDLETLGLAGEWAREHDFGGEGRCFAWIHLQGPRFPYTSTDGRADDFAPLFTDPAYDGPVDGFRRPAPGDPPASEADRDYLIGLYDAEVARADDLIARFLTHYSFAGQSQGGWDDTLLVLIGCGGEVLFRDGESYGHGDSLHDTVLRVPFLLRHPRSLTGRRILREVVELQDTMPTLCDWFGVDITHEVRGRSLLAVTDSYVVRDFESRPAFALLGEGKAASARGLEWRLIRTSEGREELYQQRIDPLGLDDVARQHPQVVRRLSTALDAWLESGG